MNGLRKVFQLAFLLLVSPVCIAEVSTTVYLRDSNELLVPVDVNTALKYVDYGQIMVGTELAIVADSNAIEEDKMISLYIEDDSRNYGILSARGLEELGYPDSIFDAAGKETGAWIYPVDGFWPEENKEIKGFDLFTGGSDVNTGDWFIIDYNTAAIGDCNVGFYWWEYPDYGLIHELRFIHVPTRDFDDDAQVDFEDFSILAGYWYGPNCAEPDWCEGADLDNSGFVDANDLMLFTDYWLEKTK